MTREDKIVSNVPDFSQPHFFETVKALRDILMSTGSAYLIALTALSLGFRVEFFRSRTDAGVKLRQWPTRFSLPDFYRITGAKRAVHFFGSTSERLSSGSNASETRDKSRMKALLHHAGVPTPFGGAAAARDTSILNYLARAGVSRVVVKPIMGSASQGVAADVTLQYAHAHIVANPSTTFMVEQFIDGTETRILTLGKQVLAARARLPTHVIGDGVSTLTDLIDQMVATQEANPISAARLKGPTWFKNYVQGKGWELAGVPEDGDVVWLADKSVGSPDDAIDCTDQLNARLGDVALKATKALGGKFAGVDVIETPKGEYFVLEVNSKPGIALHSFPLNGAANLDVPLAILRYHFPKHDKTVRGIRRFDFLRLIDDFQNRPDAKKFDAADYAEID